VFIDLLPIEGVYRGVSRILIPMNIKGGKFEQLYNLWIEYLEWSMNSNNVYSEDGLSLLTKLKQNLVRRGMNCEVIFYSDHLTETFSGIFLGYDVFGDIGESALQKGNKIDSYFSEKLNENGLFRDYTDAEEFCVSWIQSIINKSSVWEFEISPRPFQIWHSSI